MAALEQNNGDLSQHLYLYLYMYLHLYLYLQLYLYQYLSFIFCFTQFASSANRSLTCVCSDE